MLKILFIVASVMLLSASVLADVSLVNPFEETFSDQEVFKLGSVAQGESFEIIASNETGLGDSIRWDELSVNPGTLPKDWVAFSTNKGERRIGVTVAVPKDSEPNIYQLTLTATNKRLGVSDTIYARVEVKENLLNAAISNTGLNESPLVNQMVTYEISITNNSIAPHRVMINSDLPESWYVPKELTIPSKKTVTEKLDVTPRNFGRKNFSFNVESSLTGKEVVSFNSVLLVKPTFEGKLTPTLYGLPFFSMSMLPFYYFNTIISYFL
jgi:hypothetical protein